MVTVSAFAQAAALCVSAINPDGSQSKVDFDRLGWKFANAPIASQAGAPFESFETLIKAGYPAILLSKRQSKWSCMVWQQTAENEQMDVSEDFFRGAISAISTAIDRHAVPSDNAIIFQGNGATKETPAKLIFDGKDYNFVAGDF